MKKLLLAMQPASEALKTYKEGRCTLTELCYMLDNEGIHIQQFKTTTNGDKVRTTLVLSLEISEPDELTGFCELIEFDYHLWLV